jgi:UPF0716 protein FxsA
MHLGRYVLFALLLLPAAEIAAFVAVASAIGFLKALALFLGTSLLGLLILRGEGIARVVRASRAGPQQASLLELQAANLVVLVGGALLVIPGFITDAIGLVLLVAPQAVSRAVLRRLFGRRPDATPPGVVDLDRDHWRQVPDRPIEDRRDRDRDVSRRPG